MLIFFVYIFYSKKNKIALVENLSQFSRCEIIDAHFLNVLPPPAVIDLLKKNHIDLFSLCAHAIIFNCICIQITSPGGTPIRGKNARYRQRPPVLTAPSFIPSFLFLFLLFPLCVHHQLTVLCPCY